MLGRTHVKNLEHVASGHNERENKQPDEVLMASLPDIVQRAG